MPLSRSIVILCIRSFSASTLQHSAAVPLTADLYAVKRGAYAELRDFHLRHFRQTLRPGRVLTDPSELECHNVDWFKTFRGNGKVVLKPETTEEVAAILKFCNDENLAVVPQGGNTGVLGGSVPIFDEVIISSSSMNKIIKINDIPGSIVCQAGCVLETLDNALAEHGLMMPLDLGAKGSCHIGGNIATNAGGLRLLRYGSLQANTLGLVAVRADGQIVDCMNTLKKDNTGYHLKHLFIGSEGTLGIVTEVAIQCPPKPQSVSMAFLGVLGGSVPIFDEVIISSSSMNKIIKINDIPGSIVCQAGCVLETLDNALAEHGLMMPLDLGAKGSCHIGGNIATNAGGLRLLRYGSLQANTLGLVAVRADGQIVDCMNTLKKDNTGYHLKHLFIGSEGTLGIVTEVAIQCPPKPQSVSMAFLGMKTFDHALQCFRLARSLLSEVMSSCEVIDSESLRLVTNKLGVPSPLADHQFYILLEVSGSCHSHDEEKLGNFLEKALNDGTITDGMVTSEPSKMNRLWQLRERIPEALFTESYAHMYDISLPLDCYYQIVPELRTRLRDTEVFSVTGFGHLGDGNLHLNICAQQFSTELLAQIEPFVFEWISQRGGSISAEHGIGFKKTKFLRYSKTDAAIDTMRQIKQLMDPKGILNPYKVLPLE